MNFDFSPEQKSLQAHARRFLADRCSTAAMRNGISAPTKFVNQIWSEMNELGWPAISVPESLGGVGLGTLEVCVLMEEMGRALMPAPFFSTVCLGVELLKSIASAEANAVLAMIAAGKTLCVSGVGIAQANSSGISLLVKKDRVSGNIKNVRDLHIADMVICPGLSESNELLLLKIALNEDGIACRSETSLDSFIQFGSADFNETPVTILARGQKVQALLDKVSYLGATYLAFEQIGGADAALELTKDYALTRHAFARPIGANQAVKHKLAEMAVRIELARSNAYYAAWAAEQASPEIRIAAATARISACEAYDFTAKECLHLHGGIGYTWEADCHFHYKRARLLSVYFGGVIPWSTQLMTALERGCDNNLHLKVENGF
ncbi:MAG TPA: acyl-CoA dehydrogenase family protein [Pseudomonadales bacterium]|nr:acyl-CoA dehydrogenase family protein [Pseudomonadales bacterium]